MDMKQELKIKSMLLKMKFSEATEKQEQVVCIMNEENTIMVVAKSDIGRKLISGFEQYSGSKPNIDYDSKPGFARFNFKLFKKITDFMDAFKVNFTVKVGDDMPITMVNDDVEIILAPSMRD